MCVCVFSARGLSLYDNMLSVSLLALHLHPAGILSDADVAHWVFAAQDEARNKELKMDP